MTSCYRVTMRDDLGPFVPIIVAADPQEAVAKARVLSAELFGADADMLLLRVQYRHESRSHLHDRTNRGRQAYDPPANRRIVAQQLRGER